MPLNSVNDYSVTASNNTDIQSVDIDEGCKNKNLNNAVRELMADIADLVKGNTTITGLSVQVFTSNGIDDNATSIQLTLGDTEASFANRVTIASVDPIMYFKETDGATDNKIWALAGTGQDFVLQPRNDAGGASGRYIRWTRSSNNQLAQMQFLTAGSAWAYFDNTTQTLSVTGGTVDFAAGTAASVPSNFSADGYLTEKVAGVTKYIPYSNTTW